MSGYYVGGVFIKQHHKCINCGREFDSFNLNPTYCSVKCKGEYARHKINVDEMIRLYEQGHTQQEVAELLGTTQKVIYKRMKEIGYKARVAKKRNQYSDRNDSWKGGKTVHSSGYKMIQRKEHPRASICGGYVFEHILIVEAYIGRLLHPDEFIHHINGDKTDNRLENLYITNMSEHRYIHNHNIVVISNLDIYKEGYN